MNTKESKFIIKKYLKENVYRLAKIEIPNITQIKTAKILDNKVLNGMKTDDILTVVNIADAYKYINDHFEDEINVDRILEIHNMVAYHQALESGVIRYGNVGIVGCVKYIPPDPEFVDLSKMFEKQVEILQKERIDKPIETSINYLLDSCRNQYFWDGNKRTAFIIANYSLLQSGDGLLGIDDENEEFASLLTDFYETGKKSKIANYLYDSCLYTYGFEKEHSFDISYFNEKDKQLDIDNTRCKRLNGITNCGDYNVNDIKKKNLGDFGE